MSTLTWRKAGASLKSRIICVRSFAASSVAVGASGVDGGMFAGRLASYGCATARGTFADGCSAARGINDGLRDRLRTLAGGRARMMPLRGRVAAASSGR